MDTFVDSSWYFFRHCSPHAEDAPFHTPDVERWMPVTQYTGGINHAVLHLLYSRYCDDGRGVRIGDLRTRLRDVRVPTELGAATASSVSSSSRDVTMLQTVWSNEPAGRRRREGAT